MTFDPESTLPDDAQVATLGQVGRYLLLKKLGQGGMAEVFLARQDGPSDFSKIVVVKRMLAHLTENKKFVEMFLREARVAARLNHPNVVHIFELGQDGSTYFLAMEWIDGLTLHRLARRSWARGRSLPTEVIVQAMADAAIGLHHAHTLVDESGTPSRLVHRDISPDNLMMTKDGVTKVLDFGLAKGSEKSGVTKTGELKGKIPYMSPEQIEGRPLDARTDLFSLGVTFYWLLCGRRPFDAVTEVMTLRRVIEDEAPAPSTVNKSVPPALDRIVLRLLEKDPDKRYASGAALHERLVRLLDGESSSRTPARALVAETIAMPDPDEDNSDETLKVPRANQPASVPISATFAPTTVTRGEIGARRGALTGITAAAVVGFAAAITLLVLSRAPVSDAVVDAGAIDHATTATVVAPPVDAAAVVDAGDAPASPRAEEPQQKDERAPALRPLTLKGPATVAFHVGGGGPKHGGTVVKVRPGLKTVTATDLLRGSTHVIPVINDVADFASLGTGTLLVRAVPFAQISVGADVLGQTPPPKPATLAAGEYVVKLTWESHVKMQKVTIERGKTVELRVKMNE